MADYPAPVYNRNPAIGGGGAAPIVASLPRVRIWPVHLRETAGATSVVVSQQFVGPAVVAELTIGYLNQGNNPLPDFGLYVSDDPSGAGINQAVGFVPSGDSLFDLGSSASDNASNAIRGGANWSVENIGGAQGGPNSIPLRIPITRPTFYLKLRVTSPAALSVFVGSIRVIEGLTAEDLPNFL